MNLITSSFQTLIAHCLIFLQGLIVIPLITKLSSIEDYGFYIIIISLLGIIYGFSSFGYGYNATRYLPSSSTIEKRSELFVTQLYFQIISIILLSVVLLIILHFGKKFNYFSLRDLSLTLLPLYLLSQVIYSQSIIFLRYTTKFGLMNLATVLTPYLFIIFSLLAFYFFNELKLNWLVSSNIIAMSLVGCCVFFIIRKEINTKISIPSLDIIKRDISLGLPLALSFLVETMVIVGDRYVIAFFMTIKDVGNYSAAYSIGGLSVIIAKTFNVIVPPFISKMVDLGNVESSTKVIKIALRTYFIFAVPFIYGSFIFAKEILEIFTTKEAAEMAWSIIPIISISSIFFGINIILSTILFVQKRTKILFKINLSLALINLSLNLLLIGIFRNIEIAAVTTVISYLIGSIWLISYLNTRWLDGITLKYIVYVNTISLIMFSIVLFFKSIFYVDNILLKTSCLIVFGFFIYLVLIFLTKKIVEEDILLIKKLFKFNSNNEKIN